MSRRKQRISTTSIGSNEWLAKRRARTLSMASDVWSGVSPEDLDTEQKKSFSDLSLKQKIFKVLFIIFRVIVVFALLYGFICSIDIMSSAFQLVAGRAAGSLFRNSELLNNPVCGLMIGVIVTAVLQSSSTTTSIIVAMVSSGVIEVRMAIPIIMGANIGTSVTSIIVSMFQSGDRDQFRRAFAAAIVHDVFNWLCVLILLPIEALAHPLEKLTEKIVRNFKAPSSTSSAPQFLKVITSPLTNKIVQIDKQIVQYIAQKDDEQAEFNKRWPLLKYWCDEKIPYILNSTTAANSKVDSIKSRLENVLWAFDYNATELENNSTLIEWKFVNETIAKKCSYLFHGQGIPGAKLSEGASGAILLGMSLLCLCIFLVLMVKTLSSILRGPLAGVVRDTLNAEFPGKFAFLTGYVAILIGAGLTMLVQSSSVFTSMLTPLVGLGVVHIERVYPLELGANVGTTGTAILAALTSNNVKKSLQIALCHCFFNIFGLVLFYPIPPTRRFPIFLAKKLGDITAVYRWFAIAYLIFMFLIFPGIIFGLSIPGWKVLVGVGVPFILLIIFIVIVKVLQDKKPEKLPFILRTWKFLPEPLRSLAPYDRVLVSIGHFFKSKCSCCCCCCKKNESEKPHPDIENEIKHNADEKRSPKLELKIIGAKPKLSIIENGNAISHETKEQYDNSAFCQL